MKDDQADNDFAAPLTDAVVAPLKRAMRPGSHVEARVIAELHRAGVLRRMPSSRLLVAAAAGIAFVAGVVIGRNSAGATEGRGKGVRDSTTIDVAGVRVEVLAGGDASIVPIIRAAVASSVARAPLVAPPVVPASVPRSITWF